MPELTPGELLGGCRVEGVIARGGMGVVYRAVQLDLQRPVALKVITADRAGDPEFRERFARESRMAAAIDHPNVVPVYAAGEERGALYIVMRYVPGRDLHALIKDDGPLPAGRAATIVAQVAAALDVAHAAGLVHRDVKPANVLLAGSGDHAYLSDFGLMRTLDPLEPLTDSGSWIGTVDFASPEQLAGERVDARSDVYSLGCVLYAALTGVPPYPRETVPATLLAHMRDPIPRPSAKGAGQYFDRIVARGLAKEPEDRYPSAGDLGRAALAAARGEPVTETERTVAIGSAAPGGMKASDVTAPTSVAPPRPQRAPRRLWSGPPAPPAQPARTAPPPPPKTPPPAPAPARTGPPGHTRARTVRNAPAHTPAPAPPPHPPAPHRAAAAAAAAGAGPAASPSSPRSPCRSPASSPSPCSCSTATSARSPPRRPGRSPTARCAPSPRPSPTPTRPRTAAPSAACSRATCAASCRRAPSRAAATSSPSTRRSFARTPRRATSSKTSKSRAAPPAAQAATTACGALRAPRSRGEIVLGVIRDKGRTRIALIAVTPRRLSRTISSAWPPPRAPRGRAARVPPHRAPARTPAARPGEARRTARRRA